MKKILALVLVMAVASFAVTFTGTDNEDGTVTISYDAPIVGMALNVDGVSISDVALPAFFDVYMDYAYEQGVSYVYGAGTAIALQGEAGTATLPSDSFCISAGGLEDYREEGEPADTVPAAGDIVLTIAGYAELADGTYTITIDENTLRGGIVDFDGYIADNNLPITIDVVVEGGDPPLTPEQEQWNAMNVNDDGTVNLTDINNLVSYINANASAPFWTVAVTTENANFDANGDNVINLTDINNLVSYINANASAPFWTIAYPE